MIKKMLGVILSGILLCSCTIVFAQSYEELALSFSRTTPGGSARILGLGGSQISLGGDYSSALSNPAGLGMYNRSEFTLSTGFNSLATTAGYLGNSDKDSKSSLNIPGFSLVFNMPKNNTKGFLGGSFGITMSRINDFNQSMFYHGTNKDNSIIDSFIDNSNGGTVDQFDYDYNSFKRLGYDNFLLGPESFRDPNGDSTRYFTDVKNVPDQQEQVQTKGSSYQWSFSYGANISDKLFIGGGLGITTLHYKTNKVYKENFPNDPVFSDLQVNENLDIKGSGVNATVGVIARPVNFIQLGASFTTPTIYQLSETYDASLGSNWKNFDYQQGDKTYTLNDEYAETDIITSDYSLTTPLKFSTGITFISKYGFLTGDVEFVNAANSKYHSTTEGFTSSDYNQGIKSTYQGAINYRLGAEFRYDIWRARVGYGVQGNSYRSAYDIDNTITTYSGGLGVKTKTFSIDFALVNSSGKNTYYPYSIAPPVALKNNMVRGVITVGFTF